MRGIDSFLLFLLLDVAVIRMAPAVAGASIDSSTSVIQLDNSIISVQNATSSLSGSFCSNSNKNSKVERHMISIPYTTTILNLFYCPDLPLDRGVILQTIVVARMHMGNQRRIYGDRSLRPADDPYETPVVRGMNCSMSIYSLREPGTQLIPYHLTYQITLNALQGIFKFLYEDNHAASAVSEVLDPSLTGSMKKIGLIIVSPRPALVDES